VPTKAGSNDRVEFAVRFPGHGNGGPLWLPIDAKFPQEDYQRIVDASEQANPVLLEESSKQLENRIRLEAKTICDKYIDPPHTTDFAIMFLPTEGLYAEVIRRPGLTEDIQRSYRIIVTGPTTLAALLNSLQMGFRTLAIEKRSGEVWSLLGAVKSEFGKFGDILDKTQKKLQEASNTIESAATRTRQIERKLRDVQELPSGDAVKLLSDDPGAQDEEIA
jgi:DNA recombination protein RmuC